MLEDIEQRELIESLERAAGRQAHYSKALLAVLGLLLAALYLFFAGAQLLAPWHTPHQARFSGLLRPQSMAAAELAGATTALLAMLSVLFFPGHSWRKLLSVAALLAVLQSLFWTVSILRVAHAEQATLGALWRLLWLPIVPPSFVGLMALACTTLASTDAGLRRLRASQYAYKRA